MQAVKETERLCVHIRWLISRDLPEVLAIEAASFEPPWSEEDFLAALRQRNCIGMVAEAGEAVVGYTIYTLEKGHLRLHNLAVDPAFRRRGVASQLVEHLLRKLSSHRRNRLVADDEGAETLP